MVAVTSGRCDVLLLLLGVSWRLVTEVGVSSMSLNVILLVAEHTRIGGVSLSRRDRSCRVVHGRSDVIYWSLGTCSGGVSLSRDWSSRRHCIADRLYVLVSGLKNILNSMS